MSNGAPRRAPRWPAILAWALLLLFAGAALATWGLSKWDDAARFLGVAPRPTAPVALRAGPPTGPPTPSFDREEEEAMAPRLAAVESRLRLVENASRRTAGSVGRADALLVAFASRRAIDRGVPLGYLEGLLADRFGGQHPRAVGAIVTASRNPVTLEELIEEYEELGPVLRRGAPNESLWQGIKRELASIVSVRQASTPSGRPQARYDRALAHLRNGHVDAALAETIRLPRAQRAAEWVAKARRHILAQRALDEIESAALLAGGR